MYASKFFNFCANVNNALRPNTKAQKEKILLIHLSKNISTTHFYWWTVDSIKSQALLKRDHHLTFLFKIIIKKPKKKKKNKERESIRQGEIYEGGHNNSHYPPFTNVRHLNII